MKNSFKSKFTVINGFFLLAGIFAVGYIVFICLSYNFVTTWIQVVKDILGFLSFGLSFSLAVKIKITVNNYKAEHQTIVNGDQNNIEVSESQETIDKHNVLITINEIICKTKELTNVLSSIDTQRRSDIVSDREQRYLIEGQKKFEAEITKLKIQLSNGVSTINDEKFNEILNECINITTIITTRFNELYISSKSPFPTLIKGFKKDTVKILESSTQLLKENNSELKDLK